MGRLEEELVYCKKILKLMSSGELEGVIISTLTDQIFAAASFTLYISFGYIGDDFVMDSINHAFNYIVPDLDFPWSLLLYFI